MRQPQQSVGIQSEDVVVSFDRVWKRYGDVVAGKDLNLGIRRGEFLSFLGPSGCGKTTLLRMIAGFEQPTEGEVFLSGRRVNGIPAYQRRVNMVFQHYALFPHLNIADNIAYGLRQQSPKLDKREIKTRTDEALALVQLEDFDTRRIWELSGGQQQRVALARALINKPDVLLLDEPLAALDRKLRREMQIELQNLQRNTGVTFVLVTHDQEEALSMSDRVCIMGDGEIVQVGTPRELYDQPANRYIADFVGKSNFFSGSVESNTAFGVQVRLANGERIESSVTAGATLSIGDTVSVSVRPEQLVLARDQNRLPVDHAIQLSAKVDNRIFLGEHTEYLLSSDTHGSFLALSPRQNEALEPPFEVNETIHVCWGRDASLVLPDN